MSLVAAFAMSATGCKIIWKDAKSGAESAPHQPSGPPAPPPIDFDPEEENLAKAKQQLKTKDFAAAAQTANDVRRWLDERDLPRKVQDRVTELRMAAMALEGLARKEEKDVFAALFVLDQPGIDPERCDPLYRAECEAMAQLAYDNEDYETLFQVIKKGYGSTTRAKSPRVDSAFTFRSVHGLGHSYDDTSIQYFLREYVQRLREERRPYAAVWVSHGHDSTLVTRPVGKRMTYRFTGKAHRISGTSCRGAGQVRIGGRSYNVERCRKSTSHYRPAVVTLAMSEADARDLDFDAGDEALVVFEPRRIVGSATHLNLGEVRVARVRKGVVKRGMKKRNAHKTGPPPQARR